MAIKKLDTNKFLKYKNINCWLASVVDLRAPRGCTHRDPLKIDQRTVCLRAPVVELAGFPRGCIYRVPFNID